MEPAWLRAAIPLVGLAADAAAQVAVFRLRSRAGMLKSLLAGFAIGLIATLALEVCVDWRRSMPVGDSVGALAANLLAYAALGYCYFHFVNLGETARRIRILRELIEAGGTLSEAELLARYNAAEIVRVRIGRLLKTGQIVLADGRYVIARRALLVSARIVVMLKRLTLGRPSEFEPS